VDWRLPMDDVALSLNIITERNLKIKRRRILKWKRSDSAVSNFQTPKYFKFNGSFL
jgi:hypothetical protein